MRSGKKSQRRVNFFALEVHRNIWTKKSRSLSMYSHEVRIIAVDLYQKHNKAESTVGRA